MKRIGFFVVCGLAAFVLLMGIIHSTVVVVTDSWNQRTVVASLDNQGRIMTTDSLSDMGDATRWRFVNVGYDHIERITPRQNARRQIRQLELMLDNHARIRPHSDPANDDQRNANARHRAELEADIAIARAEFRSINTDINMHGFSTFFAFYLTPFALLSIAAAIYIVNRGKNRENNG